MPSTTLTSSAPIDGPAPHGLDSFLATYDLPEVERVLSDGTVSAVNAANQVNDLSEARAVGLKTSKTSVRRYRTVHGIEAEAKRSRLSELIDPQTPGAEQLPKVQPKGTKVPQWSVGVDIDHVNGSGEIRTRPEIVVPGQPAATPDEARILAEFGLSADEFTVTAYRESRWQVYNGDELRAHRVSVAKRVNAGSLDMGAVEELLARYPARPRQTEPGKGTLVVALGDIQAGKGHPHPDDPGTGAIVDRFARCIQQVEERIQTEFGGHLEALCIGLLGDMIEGLSSQRATLPVNLGITDQIRVVRRLVFHMLATLAPYADRVLVLCVPGNHDEPTRVRQLASRDSHAVDAISAVQDQLSMDPDRYGHIDFLYPPGFDDLSVAVEVNGVVLGATHGHVLAGPDKAGTWLAGQALGKQPIGQADLLLVGHHHTFSARDVGGGRSVVAAPALDNGSQWWSTKRGVESMSGVLSFELTQQQPFWSRMEMHAG